MSLHLLLAVPLSAGSARTMEGRTFHGQLRLDNRGFFMMTQHIGPQVRIDLPALLEGRFGDDPAAGELERGAVLKDGRALSAEAIESADGRRLHLRRADGRVIELDRERVSELHFTAAQGGDAAGVPGVLLRNGDFIEGRLRGLNGRLRIDSILFGPMTFDPQQEVARVVLARPGPPAAAAADVSYLVGTRDGTILHARSLRIEAAKLIVEDELLGRFDLPGEQLLSIRYVGQRITPLADLPPLDRAGGAAPPSETGKAILRGHRPASAIVMPAGSQSQWKPDPRHRLLLARVGVSERFLPTGRVRFVVSIDDRDVYTSPPLSSIDDPLDVTVPVPGGAVLTLRVEAAGQFSPAGLWADPLLLRD